MLPPLVAPLHVREPGGITNVRGQTWMESMETEAVLSQEIVTFGIRWLTALVESKRPLWWFDVHDDADEFSLIDICNQISRYPKFLVVIRQASNIAFKLNISCYCDIFYFYLYIILGWFWWRKCYYVKMRLITGHKVTRWLLLFIGSKWLYNISYMIILII